MKRYSAIWALLLMVLKRYILAGILLFVGITASAQQRRPQKVRITRYEEVKSHRTPAMDARYLLQQPPHAWPADSLYLQTLPVDDTWWQVFQDSRLDSLINQAQLSNYSALMAVNRMEQARLSLAVGRGAYSPTLSLGAGWNRQKTSGNVSGSTSAYTGYYHTDLTLSWEADVFGRIRSKVRAAKADYRASQDEYYATMVALAAQVATAYFSLRQNQEVLAVLQANATSQLGVVQLTEARFKAGLVAKLDVAQARSVYYATLASIPSVEANIIEYSNALAVLLGGYPQTIRRSLASLGREPLPDFVELVPVGLPANLLRRRPDVRQAEQNILAQRALLDASYADWWPTFTLAGSIGYASRELDKLTRQKSLTWSIAPTLTWTLWNGAQNYNATRLQRYQMEEAVLAYNQTVLTAVQEVDDAMATYSNAVKQVVAMKQVVYQNEVTLRLSLDLYKQGLTMFQNVLDAQRSLLAYEESLVETQGYALTCLVAMYKALGGGW